MTSDNTRTEEDVLDRVGSRIDEALHRIVGPASPNSVFSEPTTVGEDLVFAAAAWERGAGFGFGAGQGTDPAKGSGSGGGGGGGGGSQGRPVAIIRVGPDGIEVRPVLDYTKLGFTLLLSALGVWKALRRR